jgi:hypothetical protein
MSFLSRHMAIKSPFFISVFSFFYFFIRAFKARPEPI